MTDIVTSFFLSFSHDTVIIPFVIIGYIWLDRNLFFNAICLILLSIIFNSALKITFQIPLSPLLNKEGFAFPSGHMMSSAVLYGWILLHTQNLFHRTSIIIVLFGIAFSLVHCGYHNYYDILGAAFFALLLVTSYYKILKINRAILAKTVFIITTVMMIYIGIRYTQIPKHLWIAYYGLIGITISEKVFTKNQAPEKILDKLLSTIACFSSILITEALFSMQIFSTFPEFLSQIKWMIIAFSIPFAKIAPNLVRKYVCK